MLKILLDKILWVEALLILVSRDFGKKKVKGNKKGRKIKNKFKINKWFLYIISNLFYLFFLWNNFKIYKFFINFNYILFIYLFYNETKYKKIIF